MEGARSGREEKGGGRGAGFLGVVRSRCQTVVKWTLDNDEQLLTQNSSQ